MSNRFASSIAVGLLAMASCARVSSTSAVDGGGGGASSGGTGGARPVNGPDAMVSPTRPGAPDKPINFTCGAGKDLGNAGCSFYGAEPTLLDDMGFCYVMFVVNPGTQPAKLTLQRAGKTYAMAKVARLPRGSGLAQTYAPFDPAVGLAPDSVALLFLSGRLEATMTPYGMKGAACPMGTEPAEVDQTATTPSNVGAAFHLTSDRPVVVYHINPYGGANSYVTSASLLLPEETWGRANLVPTPVHEAMSTVPADNHPTYVTVIAAQDGTEVSIKAPTAIMAGLGVDATPAGQALRLKLSAGQYAQVTEQFMPDKVSYTPGMSGTLVTANKPVAVVGGSPCVDLPADVHACDSAHQQIPPFSAWGNQYAGVSYRSRLAGGEEPVPWMLVGAVDGTVLTYSPKAPTPDAVSHVGPPTTLGAGQVVQFWTADPFVVRSQDADHPFYLAAFMTGGEFQVFSRLRVNQGAGDPEFVNVVATDQYMKDYTFMTDPTYPETNLVVVRKPGADGRFADVKLGCAATPISGWQSVGALQFARVDLVTGDFRPVIPGCNNGVNRMYSAEPFSLTVWGWGTQLPPKDGQASDLRYTSYGYPAGSALGIVNRVPEPVIQ